MWAVRGTFKVIAHCGDLPKSVLETARKAYEHLPALNAPAASNYCVDMCGQDLLSEPGSTAGCLP